MSTESVKQYQTPATPFHQITGSDKPQADGDVHLPAVEPSAEDSTSLFPSDVVDAYAKRLPRSLLNNADEIKSDFRQFQRDFQQSIDRAADQQKMAVQPYAANEEALPEPEAEEMGTPPHIKALEDLIGKIHNDYQKIYAKINEKAAEFMKDMNTALGKISDFIKAGDDGKIKFDKAGFLKAMDEILKKYTNNPGEAAVADKPIFTFEGNNDALAFWQEKLGTGFSVKRGSGNTIEIFPNLDPMREVYKSVNNAKIDDNDNNVGDMHIQSFQSLQAALDSQKNSINNSVSQLLEKFRQDNSTFETLIQLLTRMTEDLHRYNAGYLNT